MRTERTDINHVHQTLIILFASCFIVLSCKDDDESPADGVSIVSITPESPATLKFYQTGPNDRVVIKYNYNISHKEGGRIWIQPFTDGSPSDGYLYSSSSVYNGSGSREVLVSIDEGGATHVDALRVVIKNPDQSLTLYEETIDVDYTFEE